jgi:hypothetical protein
LRMRLGTDGVVALRHGFRAAMLTSLDEHGSPSNYHWPTDTPDRVDYGRLGDTVLLCEAVARTLAEQATPDAELNGSARVEQRARRRRAAAP